MTTTPGATPKATVSEGQLQQMAVEILQEIPEGGCACSAPMPVARRGPAPMWI